MAAPFFDEGQGTQKLISWYDKCLNVDGNYVENSVPYNKGLFSSLYFLTSQSEADFGIAFIHT
jgi:hypothetical protein